MKMIKKKKIALISTGGTIEKTYSELEGILHYEYSVLDIMLEKMQIEGIEITRIPLIKKDSLHLEKEDYELIIDTLRKESTNYDGLVVVHGTDRLEVTGEKAYKSFCVNKDLLIPIVFTGAMRPYILRNSDAPQNLSEALLAVQLLKPGIYVVMHNTVLQFPGVCKDRKQMTFKAKTKES